MRRRLTVVSGLLLFSGLLHAQSQFPVYRAERVRQIHIGDAPGQLGYWEGPGIAFVPSRPVASGDLIYVMDTANGRLNVYDRDFRFIRQVDFDEPAADLKHAYYFEILSDGGIIGISSTAAVRITNQGKVVYRIPADRLPPHVWNGGQYWMFEDNLLFTEREGGGQIRAIDGNGRFLAANDLARLAEVMKSESKMRQESPDLRDAIDQFLSDNKLMLAGDRDLLLSWNPEQCNQFYTLIRDHSASPIRNQVQDAEYSLVGAAGGTSDDEGNRLWYLTNLKENRRLWYIISPRGKVIDVFEVSPEGRQQIGSTQLVFAYWFVGDGDLYSLVQNESTYDAYRVVLRSEHVPRQASTPTASSTGQIALLAASSTLTEPADKNAYHPVKLFDGDPKTMWIENAKGPGIGESVTVGFEVPLTADEIQFMPGAFWKEYWKQNYRVKQLEVKLDGKTFTANFTDQMVVQSLRLPSAVTFTTVMFTIKDVYPTTKWEDTAISEIAFYNQGAKIDVDYSKYKDFLKKAP